MYSNSYEHMKNIQSSLNYFSGSLEDLYHELKAECEEENKKNIQDQITQRNEMNRLFEMLQHNYDMRLTWIKNKLPWYITRFHKISSNEILIINGIIFIGVAFGKSTDASCYIKITPKDIGW